MLSLNSTSTVLPQGCLVELIANYLQVYELKTLVGDSSVFEFAAIIKLDCAEEKFGWVLNQGRANGKYVGAWQDHFRSQTVAYQHIGRSTLDKFDQFFLAVVAFDFQGKRYMGIAKLHRVHDAFKRSFDLEIEHGKGVT